jgi:glycosyltransferase involved in cell wall biosynthesis
MTICLNPDHSTTRRVVESRPAGLRDLPPHPGRIAEGGLRCKGRYKVSAPGRPLITVITVVIDRVHLFEKTIRSIVDQSYDNVEYIVIDGGSTDGTLDLLRKYDDVIDYWVSEPDDSLYHAMNKGVEIASGDWLNFQGSDDVLVDTLNKIAGKLVDTSTVYYGDSYMTDRNVLYDGWFSQYKMTFKCINHQAVFFPKAVFDVYEYDTAYINFADYILMCQCNADNRFRFRYINELVAMHDDKIGVSYNRIDHKFLEDRLRIIKTYFPLRYYLMFMLRVSSINFLDLLGAKIMIKKFLNVVFNRHYDTSY